MIKLAPRFVLVSGLATSLLLGTTLVGCVNEYVVSRVEPEPQEPEDEAPQPEPSPAVGVEPETIPAQPEATPEQEPAPREPEAQEPEEPEPQEPEPTPPEPSAPAPEPAPEPEPEPEPTRICYSEPIFPDADISAYVANYGGSNWKQELIGALTARHPATGWLLNAQQNDSYFYQFSDQNNWGGMVGWLDTLSHEETHLFNAYHAIAVGRYASIYLGEDQIYYLDNINDLPRSIVVDTLAPDVRNGIYTNTYLSGSQGQRGFNELLDETASYLNEIGAVGSVGEYFPGFGVSLRDGAPALMHFTQKYLQQVRQMDPGLWDFLRNDPVYQEVVLTLWVRLHFLLPYADAFPNLGISDQMYRDAMHLEDNIQILRDFTGLNLEAGPCYNVSL